MVSMRPLTSNASDSAARSDVESEAEITRQVRNETRELMHTWFGHDQQFNTRPGLYTRRVMHGFAPGVQCEIEHLSVVPALWRERG
jgi:hypothetical protein